VSEQDKEKIQPNLYLFLSNGVTNEFRGVLQLKLNDYKILTENDLNKYGFDLNDFVINAPLNIEKEYEHLLAILNDFKNETFKKITLQLIKKYEKEFLLYPAAMSIHHNVKGGLF
jgi:3'-5' exoribonuclease